jgi:radical SAM superfamily enzyme YgiQ (UPF0313 family)
MKVLILFPTDAMDAFICFPLVPYHLASVLRQQGHHVIVPDPALWPLRLKDKTLLAKLLKQVEVVAISSNSLNWHCTLRTINGISDIDVTIPIILGGVHPTYFDAHVLGVSQAHYAVRGEGEKTLIELLEAIESGSGVEGILGLSYKNADGQIVRNPDRPVMSEEELGRLPLPAYDLATQGKFTKLLPYESSRGCLFDCFFCSITHRRLWRGREAEQVAKDLVEIRSRYAGFGGVFLVDDCFTTSPERVLEISERLRRAGFTTPLLIEARISDLLKDERVVQSLSHLNITEIQVGVECGYDAGLKKVRKGLTTEMVWRGAELLSRFGLDKRVLWSFILGFPWERNGESLQTIEFAAQLISAYSGVVNFSWWLPVYSYGWQVRHSYGLEFDERVFDSSLGANESNRMTVMLPHVTEDLISEVNRRVESFRRQQLNMLPVQVWWA